MDSGVVVDVNLATRKADTLRVLLMVLWETKSLDDNKYIALSVHLDEIGKMLGGLKKQIQNKSALPRENLGLSYITMINFTTIVVIL